MSGEKSKRNSVSKPSDKKTKDNKSRPQKEPKKPADTDGDEEMTVVVPPSKSDKPEENGDVTMNGVEQEKKEEEEKPVDPKEKAATGMLSYLAVLKAIANPYRHTQQSHLARTCREPI